jgi:hypothetical protein
MRCREAKGLTSTKISERQLAEEAPGGGAAAGPASGLGAAAAIGFRSPLGSWASERGNGAQYRLRQAYWQGLFIRSLLTVCPGAAMSEFWTARVDPWCRQLDRGMKARQNSKAGETLSKSPQYTPSFFSFYIHCTCGRVSTPYARIDLLAREIMHPHRMDGRGSAKHRCGQPRPGGV